MFYIFPFLIVAIALSFSGILSSRRLGRAKFVDIGLVFVAIVVIYSIFPSIGFLLAVENIGGMADNRLQGVIDIEAIQEVQYLVIAALSSFSVSYLYFRRFNAPHIAYYREPTEMPWLFGGLFVGLQVLTVLFKWLLGVQFSTDYIGTYTELRGQSVLAQQIFNTMNLLTSSSLIATIVFLLAARPALFRMLLLVVLLNIGYAFLTGGSRTEAFVSLFALMVAGSIFKAEIKAIHLIPLGAAGLFAFLVIGFIRGGGGGEFAAASIFQEGEFVAHFSNGVDLIWRIWDGTAAPYQHTMAFADLFRMIPSQLLGGVQKVDPATWYAETFYREYFDAGGGFAFGMIAESIMGYGMTDAIVRGILLGLVFAFAGNYLLERSNNVFAIFVYIWLTVVCYQSFRDTTFTFLARGVYQLGPIYILYVLAKMQSARRGVA